MQDKDDRTFWSGVVCGASMLFLILLVVALLKGCNTPDRRIKLELPAYDVTLDNLQTGVLLMDKYPLDVPGFEGCVMNIYAVQFDNDDAPYVLEYRACPDRAHNDVQLYRVEYRPTGLVLVQADF